jgi:hypothetical protein
LDRARQLAITSYVETVDAEAHAAAFLVGFRPSWSVGDRTGERAWLAEAWIGVDCQHVIDHDATETVHDCGDVRAITPGVLVGDRPHVITPAGSKRPTGGGLPDPPTASTYTASPPPMSLPMPDR